MNTRYMQLYKTSNNVIKKFIQSGVFPKVSQVQAEVTRILSGNVIGSPTCLPNDVGYDTVTDPVAYNNFFTTAVNDIQLLYDMITDQLRRLSTDMDYQMTLRGRLKSQIRQLETNVNNISSSPPYVYREDLHNKININLNNTTAYINNQEAIATLPEDLRLCQKVYPDIATITQTGTAVVSSLMNLFDDSLNTAWLSTYSQSTDGSYGMTITATFNTPIVTNKILCTGFSPRAMNIAIGLNTTDGNKQLDSRPCDSYNTASWYFPTYYVTGFTMTINKDKADYSSGTSNPFTYLFGIQSLEFYSTSYLNAGTIESNIIQFYDLLNNQVPITTVNMGINNIPAPGCNTSYYLCATDNTVPDTWIRVIPGTNVTIQEPTSYKYSLNKSEAYDFDSKYAMQLYNITGDILTVPKTGNNISLTRDFMWKIRYYYYNIVQDNINQYSDSAPTIDDMAIPRGDSPDIYITFYTYAKTTDMKLLPNVAGDKKRMVMFTTYITWDSNEILTLPVLPVWWGDSSKVNIYLNDSQATFTTHTTVTGSDIKVTGVTYSLNLIQGINKLCIVTNDYFAWDLMVFNNLLSSLGITPVNSTCDMNSLTQVSMYDLLYNTRQGDISRYAIDHDGNILVTNSQNISYTITYTDLDKSKEKHNLFYKILMSQDGTTDSTNTPVINSISLTTNGA